MKKRVLIVLCLCLLFYPLSKASPEEKRGYVLDGYEWAKMSGVEKIGFVKGWIRGGHAAKSAILGLQMQVMFFLKPKTFEPALDLADKALDTKGLDLARVTFGQVVDTIDKMYSDPRVMKWETDRIMPIVWGRLKKGWTEREIDEAIAFYIKRDDSNERTKNLNFKGMSESEKYRINDEHSSLESSKPKILRALEDFE